MAKITFITQNQEKISLEATSGSVMELATAHGISGIDGECGGVCSCATCHVYVPKEHWEAVGEPNEMEKDMLEFDELVQENSRLSCQIQITEALDGISLNVARE